MVAHNHLGRRTLFRSKLANTLTLYIDHGALTHHLDALFPSLILER